MKKRLISLFLAFVMCLIPFSIVYASDGYANAVANAANAVDAGATVAKGGLANADKPTLNPSAATLGGMESVANAIIGVIKGIGYVAAVIMVMYVGIKYLTAGAGKKAEVKDTLIPILIGAVLLLGAITLVDWIWGAVGGAAK